MGAEIFTKFYFFSITSATDTLESHSRAPKMRTLAQLPNKSRAKMMSQWAGVQGQVKVANKAKTPPPQREPLRVIYITRCPKFLTYNLVQVHHKKTKYNKRVTRTDDCLVTSDSTMLTVVRFLQLSFISGRKLYAGYGAFCPSKQKTGYADC